MISIVECTPQHQSQWDSFVVNANGSYNHAFGWKQIIEGSYGLRTHYLVMRSGETWVAVLPLAVMPRLLGRITRAISLPYCNYGGLLAAPNVETAPLRQAAIRHLSSLGVESIEFRELAAGPDHSGEVTMVLSFPESFETLWNNIGAKARNLVRKAQRSDLTVQWGRSQGDELYRIYASNMGRLGTPTHSPRFFREIIAQFPDQCEVLTVRHAGQAIGAMLLIRQGTTWSDPFASCLSEYNSLSPNMLLYWEALRHACATGGKHFDFGRSQQGSGTYRFKKQWGAVELPLDYQTYLHGVLQPQNSATFYRSSSAQRLARIWAKLPGPMQRRLGPLLRRWMP